MEKVEIFKVNGATVRQDWIEKVGKNYILFHGLFPQEDGEGNYELRAIFKEKPTLPEIKELLLGWYAQQKAEAINAGFDWEDENGDVFRVPCSQTDQANYKAVWDLAFQLNGANLPYRLKLGTREAPQYKVFCSIEQMQPFVLAVATFIGRVYDEFWQKEDSIDWTNYDLSEP